MKATQVYQHSRHAAPAVLAAQDRCQAEGMLGVHMLGKKFRTVYYKDKEDLLGGCCSR